MKDFFPLLLLGHLIGDYMFQNKWMALNKSKSHFVCFVHCLIYTLTICLVTYPVISGWIWTTFVFLTHYPIDKWSLADKWLALISGRSLNDFLENGHKDIPNNFNDRNYQVLRGGFTSVVYTVVDNTIHLALMYFGYYLIFS